ncbi:MAG: hypothetical protein TREMPRED_001919 [Tremellales sp. Tagirdzhanova-0007]|nr:MAG: hypothetical protein TREMPRED_001919 [Tremellales sp. Tagirdzhanova-0007]
MHWLPQSADVCPWCVPGSAFVPFASLAAKPALKPQAMTYPLVNLSTRAAVQTKKEHLTIQQIIARTIKQEGLAGLYSGLSSSLFGIAVTNGVYYAFYEEMRTLLMRRRSKVSSSPSALTTSEGIIAGLIAGSITTLVTNPIWTVQTAQSTRAVITAEDSGKVKPSVVDAASEIFSKDGVKGFWRGIGPALILVINPVIQYTTFERLVSLLLSYRLARKGSTSSKAIGRSFLSDWDLFCLGAANRHQVKIASCYSQVPFFTLCGPTYPSERRARWKVSLYNQPKPQPLTFDLTGLYAGLLPKLLQSVLTAAFMFVAQRRIYEAVKKMILLAAERRSIAARG